MKRIAFSFLAAALLLASGCSKENGPVLVPVSLQVNLPGDDTPIYTPNTTRATTGEPAVGFDVTFTNTSTQAETTVQTDASGTARAELEEGVYNIFVYGVYQTNGKETSINIP